MLRAEETPATVGERLGGRRQGCPAQQTKEISTDESQDGVNQAISNRARRADRRRVSHCCWQLHACNHVFRDRAESVLPVLTQSEPGFGWKQLKKGVIPEAQSQAQSVSPVPSVVRNGRPEQSERW